MWGRLSLELGCPRFRQIHIHRVFPMSIVNTRTRRQIRTLPLDWNGGKWRCQQLGHPNMALASLPFGHGTGEPAFQQLIKDMSYDFPLKSDICASPSFGQSKMTCFISSTVRGQEWANYRISLGKSYFPASNRELIVFQIEAIIPNPANISGSWN